MTVIQTSRLQLRHWKESDFEPFAKINGNPAVMEFFPRTLTRDESFQFAERLQSSIEERGWGLWAVSVPDIADFIGFIGLSPVDFEANFTPAVEIGWRLDPKFWGKGYATEGAREALRYGFETIGLDEIVSFAFVKNYRSRRVMEKIGMVHDQKNDFAHPKLPKGHPLSRHVLYRMRNG